MLAEDKKLVELRPGKGLEGGLTPSVLETAGAVWRDGRHVWFREAHLQHNYGAQRIISGIHRKPLALAQAFVKGRARLYYEDLGVINYWQTNLAAPVVIGDADAGGEFDLVPWGTWLAVTDNVNQPKLWKGTGGFIDIGVGEFKTAKIMTKLGQHLLAFNTDALPSGFHWSDASDPETWEPDAFNTAGNLPIRDLDSDIVAVADMGIGLGMYSRSYLILVQYVGYPDVIGTPSQALSGVGAVSKRCIVSLGRDNWGLNRSGVFWTNGASYEYVDIPAFSTWIKETINWDRANEIAGHYDDQLGLLKWSVPVEGDTVKVLAVSPKTRAFTFLGTDMGVGLDREVFDYPIIAREDGIYYSSLPDVVEGDFFLATHLLNGGNQTRVKAWDYLVCEGNVSGAEIRFGYTNQQTIASVEWSDWQALNYRTPFGPKESMYLAFEIRSEAAIEISGLTVFGELGGEL